jgi:tRNA A-37 threonylcarbamoyl transferase component Bud32
MAVLDRQSPTRPFRLPEWDWAQAGDVGWWVRPDWRERLLGPRGLRLDEWRERGALAVIKQGPNRVVYRVDLPGASFFVKHYLVPDYRSMFRQWFRRGKGRNEGKRAIRLARTGVPTITPLALGECRKRKFLFENYLITDAIPATVPLDEFVEQVLPGLPQARQGPVRRRLATALGEATARLHVAGFVHSDFHPGNILVRLDPDDRPWLAMIDLDALRDRRRIAWNEASANLALLNHYFWVHSSRADRHRFLAAYLSGRSAPAPDLASFARGIEATTRSWAERLWLRWGKRCQSSNKYFEIYRRARSWSVASRVLAAETVNALLEDPDAPFHQPDTVLLKQSRTATVAELVLPVAGRPTKVIYKRFNRKKWLDPLLSFFRPSRAWRAWHAGQHLASRAVPTPRNLAYLARTRPGPRWLIWPCLPLEAYVLTLKAEPAITLGDYVRTVLPELPMDRRRAQVQRLTNSLARLLRTMHDRSLSNRDLKAANILIEGDPEAPEPRLSLIDLVGVQRLHPLPEHRRVQNLARLQVSLSDFPGRTHTDALRFLRVYAPPALFAGEGWKTLWREVERASRRKEDKNLRSGRALS